MEQALAAYMEQQSKVYSQVKNGHILELLGNLRGKRFLDYGCGAGMFTVYAAKSGAARVVGVDAEENVLSTAGYFARLEGVENLCQFIHSERFPFFPAHLEFDVILMKDVIEHVTDDQALLQAAAQVVAPGGVVVVSTQNSFSLNYVIQGTYHRLLLGNKEWFGWDQTHLRFYTPFSLEDKLKAAGFMPVSWRSTYLIPYKLPGWPGSGREFTRIDSLSGLDRTLGRIFPYNRLGWNVIVKAQAPPEAPEFVGQVSPVRTGPLAVAPLVTSPLIPASEAGPRS